VHIEGIVAMSGPLGTKLLSFPPTFISFAGRRLVQLPSSRSPAKQRLRRLLTRCNGEGEPARRLTRLPNPRRPGSVPFPVDIGVPGIREFDPRPCSALLPGRLSSTDHPCPQLGRAAEISDRHRPTNWANAHRSSARRCARPFPITTTGSAATTSVQLAGQPIKSPLSPWQ
jgi:hypothetical protein